MTTMAGAEPIWSWEPGTPPCPPCWLWGFGTFSAAFPGYNQEAGWEVGPPGLILVLIWDPGTFKLRTSAARPLCRVQVFLFWCLEFDSSVLQWRCFWSCLLGTLFVSGTWCSLFQHSEVFCYYRPFNPFYICHLSWNTQICMFGHLMEFH